MATTPAPVTDPVAETNDLEDRIRSRIERLKKLWDSHANTRKTASDNARYLEEDQGQDEWLKRNPGETNAHWRQKEKLTADLANKVLRDVATVYQAPPRRVVTLPTTTPPVEAPTLQEQDQPPDTPPAEPTEPDQSAEPPSREAEEDALSEWLERHIWSFGEYSLDELMHEVDIWAMFHGTVAIEPRYTIDPETDTDGIELLYYRRHEFEVLPLTDDGGALGFSDPRKAEAVVFPVRTVERALLEGVSEKQLVLHYWDDEVFCRLVDWDIDTAQGGDDPRWIGGIFRHGVGRLPILFVKDRIVQRRFYSPGAHENLVRVCQAINKLKTEHGYLLKVPGAWFSNGRLENFAVGADVIVQGDESQRLDYVRHDANLEGIQSGIQREMDDLAITFGLAPGSLVMEPQAARSGVAIQSQQRDTEALRRQRVPRYVRFEERYHRVALDVYAAFAGSETLDAIPPGADEMDISVLHQPPPTQLTDQERRDSLEWQRKHRLIGREDMLREARPDLTDAEVTQRLKDAAADSPQTGPPASPNSLFLRSAMPPAPGPVTRETPPTEPGARP